MPAAAIKHTTRNYVELNFLNISLTVTEAEELCQLTLNNDSYKTIQRELAKKLFFLYRDGGTVKVDNLFSTAGKEDYNDFAPHNEKAIKYLGLLTSSTFSLPVQEQVDEIQNGADAFTSLRLAGLRANRETTTLAGSQYNIWKDWLAYFSLSYAIEVIVGFGKILYYSVNPTISTDQKMMFWPRFKGKLKHAWNDPNFTKIMSNAFIWLIVNTICICIPSGSFWFYAINLMGFSLDVIHDTWFAFKNLRRYQSILNKLQDNSKYDDSEQIQEELHKKIQEAKIALIDKVVIATAIVVGMGLFWFPPAHFLLLSTTWWQRIGVSLVLGIGVIYGGLGRRIWDGRFFETLKAPFIALNRILNFAFEACQKIYNYINNHFYPSNNLLDNKKKLAPPINLYLSSESYEKIKEILKKLNAAIKDKKLSNTVLQLSELAPQEVALLQNVSGLNETEWKEHLLCWSGLSCNHHTLYYRSLSLLLAAIQMKIPKSYRSHYLSRLGIRRDQAVTAATLQKVDTKEDAKIEPKQAVDHQTHHLSLHITISPKPSTSCTEESLLSTDTHNAAIAETKDKQLDQGIDASTIAAASPRLIHTTDSIEVLSKTSSQTELAEESPSNSSEKHKPYRLDVSRKKPILLASESSYGDLTKAKSFSSLASSSRPPSASSYAESSLTTSRSFLSLDSSVRPFSAFSEVTTCLPTSHSLYSFGISSRHPSPTSDGETPFSDTSRSGAPRCRSASLVLNKLSVFSPQKQQFFKQSSKSDSSLRRNLENQLQSRL